MYTTLNAEFENFIACVYTDPPQQGSEQFMQLKQAFFGGALIANRSPNDFSEELIAHYREVASNAAAVRRVN